MVYGFVRPAIGGHVTVESSLGVGTTMALYLPKATQDACIETKAIQMDAVPRGSARILMAEDNEDVLEVTSALLTPLGYRITCAGMATRPSSYSRSY